jgi:hypothetical protein
MGGKSEEKYEFNELLKCLPVLRFAYRIFIKITGK